MPCSESGNEDCGKGRRRLFVTAAAAWLHDLHRDTKLSSTTQPDATDNEAIELMERAKVPSEFYQPILDSVHHTDSFSFSDRRPEKASLEAPMPARRRQPDAIGAIGIARTFTYGGSHGIPLWKPGVPINEGIYLTPPTRAVDYPPLLWETATAKG